MTAFKTIGGSEKLVPARLFASWNVWDTLLLMQQIGAVGQLGQAQRASS
jgi:hypothetical protein